VFLVSLQLADDNERAKLFFRISWLVSKLTGIQNMIDDAYGAYRGVEREIEKSKVQIGNNDAIDREWIPVE
jgi:hypothetical protein